MIIKNGEIKVNVSTEVLPNESPMTISDFMEN